MTSTCTILRDPQRRQDDVVDPATLRLSSSAGDATVVYGPAKPCWVFEAPQRDSRQWGADRKDDRPAHLLQLPGDAPVPEEGDRVVVDSSTDEAVVGSGYLLGVERVERGDYHVTRRVLIVRVGGPVPST